VTTSLNGNAVNVVGPVGAGKGRWHMSPDASRGGGAKMECGNLNYVSSVKAGMGMEGKIMCVEQCTL